MAFIGSVSLLGSRFRVSRSPGSRFRILGFGLRDWGFGFRGWGFGFRVSGSGLRDLGFRFGGWGLGFRFQGFEFRVEKLDLRVQRCSEVMVQGFEFGASG